MIGQQSIGLVGVVVTFVGILVLAGGVWAGGGNLLWEDQFDKAGGGDIAEAITAHGNRVFAAGVSSSAADNSDFLVRAYDAR